MNKPGAFFAISLLYFPTYTLSALSFLNSRNLNLNSWEGTKYCFITDNLTVDLAEGIPAYFGRTGCQVHWEIQN